MSVRVDFEPISLAQIARTITIIPEDKVPARREKRDNGFVIEGDPEHINSGLRELLKTTPIDKVADSLLKPANFNRLVVLITVNHPVIHELGLGEQPLRTALSQGAEAALVNARQGLVNALVQKRQEQIRWRQASVNTLAGFIESIELGFTPTPSQKLIEEVVSDQRGFKRVDPSLGFPDILAVMEVRPKPFLT